MRYRTLVLSILILMTPASLLVAQGYNNSPSPQGGSIPSMQLSTDLDKTDSSAALRESTASREAALAFATPDYPVSTGDVYQLIYYRSLTPVIQLLFVESDFSINLGILGVISAENLTFVEAKRAIERKVLAAYSNSAPTVTIQSLGSFRIRVTGEVQQTGYRTVNGLTRLQSVFGSIKTPYASMRSIEIVDRNGNFTLYDLYMATREGDVSQNPYLRPGDTIRLVKYERQVELSGEVRRSGGYQLQEGENLSALIEMYGDGLTRNALPAAVKIVRPGADSSIKPETIYIAYDGNGGTGKNMLEDGDTVVVPNKLHYRPVVYFEGALLSDLDIQDRTAEAQASGSTGERFARVPYRFQYGEKLSQAAESVANRFLPDSDLRNAYILRKGEAEPVSVDIERLMLTLPENEPVLQDGDRIIIPFRQLFVIVSGGVKNPGIYNYVQGRGYQYYLSLAGGLDKNEHWWGTNPVITDKAGRKVDDEEEIGIENRIHFTNNNPFRVITPVTSTVTAVLTAILLFR